MTASRRSPYLKNESRLADIVAAIQVMGGYPWASREVRSWAEKLGPPVSANDWTAVFREHPEFFRLSGDWASLRWRHGYDRTYDATRGIDLSEQERVKLSPAEADELTRRPLATDQIEALLRTAIDLHTRAIAHEEEKRWLWPLFFGLAGVVLGVVLQAALK